ncbi:potassium-transporting ATPase subunit KdpC [Thiocapsa sp.]|uniref:potassium-transporting ATPase subunit KdpC n=1 Tax=Thiocapsa sp. TaxID=2024551 RepID=UPI0025F2F1C7|nr:potassium-transporting ATPase subunit KdpC [Thiocapsa sp.]
MTARRQARRHVRPPGHPPTGWLPAVRTAVVLILLCGGLYPLASVWSAAALFPHQATGSLIEREGALVGSALVGQAFVDPGYFRGRPSAAGYDPFRVSGSNLSPGNPQLRARAATTAHALAAEYAVDPARIPVDLIAASGSGIDPHISPEAARMQVAHVAEVRGLPQAQVAELVTAQVEPPILGVLGQPRVNVLRLNLALDALGPSGAP